MKKFMQSSIWMFFSNLIIRLIAIVVTPILARNYPKEDLSIFRSLQSILLLVFVLIPLGTNLLYISESKEEREKYWSLFLLVSAICSLVSIPILYGLKIMSYNDTPLMLAFVILVPLISFFKNVYTAKYTEQIMFKEISLAIMYRQIVLYFLIIIFTFINKSIYFLMVSLLISEITEVITLHHFSKKIKGFFINFKQKIVFDKKARFFTIYTGGANTIINFSLQLPSILVLTLLGKELAIEFQMPLVLVSIPMSLIIMSVSRVMFPYLSNNRDEGKMQATILNSQYIFFILGLPICSLMIYFSQEISNIIFNPEWKNVSLALKLLSINIFFNMLQNPLSQLCLIKNKPKIGFYYAIIHLVSRLTGLYLGYNLWGFTGSVALFVAFDSAIRLGRLIIDIKLISISIKQYLLNVKIPIIALLFISLFFLLSYHIELNKILIYIAIMILYLTILFIFDKKRVELLYNILKQGLTNER